MTDFSNKLNSAMNKKFLKNMVETASPMQLIIILYDGAVQWLQMSKQEITKNKTQAIPNWTDFSFQMNKVTEILTHLQESLDSTHAPEVSERLFALYDFMKVTLFKANAKKDEQAIDEVIKLLRDLKSSWQEAMKAGGTDSRAVA